MKRPWIKWTLIGVCGAALIAGGVWLAVYLIDGAHSAQVYVETADTYYDAMDSDLPPDINTAADEAVPDEAVSADDSYQDAYDALAAINPDAVGWLSIDGTSIDYPVVQADDNEYYRRRDINEKRSSRGTIYMDWRCPAFGGGHMVLYGHNMKDSSMFGTLKAYQDAAYYEEHAYITYNMMGQNTRWRIFSVRIADDALLPVLAGKDLAAYAQEIKAQSLYDTNVDVSQAGAVLTLSTCTNERWHGRLLISAVRVDNTALNRPL